MLGWSFLLSDGLANALSTLPVEPGVDPINSVLGLSLPTAILHPNWVFSVTEGRSWITDVSQAQDDQAEERLQLLKRPVRFQTLTIESQSQEEAHELILALDRLQDFPVPVPIYAHRTLPIVSLGPIGSLTRWRLFFQSDATQLEFYPDAFAPNAGQPVAVFRERGDRQTKYWECVGVGNGFVDVETGSTETPDVLGWSVYPMFWALTMVENRGDVFSGLSLAVEVTFLEDPARPLPAKYTGDRFDIYDDLPNPQQVPRGTRDFEAHPLLGARHNFEFSQAHSQSRAHEVLSMGRTDLVVPVERIARVSGQIVVTSCEWSEYRNLVRWFDGSRGRTHPFFIRQTNQGIRVVELTAVWCVIEPLGDLADWQIRTGQAYLHLPQIGATLRISGVQDAGSGNFRLDFEAGITAALPDAPIRAEIHRLVRFGSDSLIADVTHSSLADIRVEVEEIVFEEERGLLATDTYIPRANPLPALLQEADFWFDCAHNMFSWREIRGTAYLLQRSSPQPSDMAFPLLQYDVRESVPDWQEFAPGVNRSRWSTRYLWRDGTLPFATMVSVSNDSAGVGEVLVHRPNAFFSWMDPLHEPVGQTKVPWSEDGWTLIVCLRESRNGPLRSSTTSFPVFRVTRSSGMNAFLWVSAFGITTGPQRIELRNSSGGDFAFINGDVMNKPGMHVYVLRWRPIDERFDFYKDGSLLGSVFFNGFGSSFTDFSHLPQFVGILDATTLPGPPATVVDMNPDAVMAFNSILSYRRALSNTEINELAGSIALAKGVPWLPL
jgi:hypothetical protein